MMLMRKLLISTVKGRIIVVWVLFTEKNFLSNCLLPTYHQQWSNNVSFTLKEAKLQNQKSVEGKP